MLPKKKEEPQKSHYRLKTHKNLIFLQQTLREDKLWFAKPSSRYLG